MKKIILMAGLLAMGSMYVAADEQSEVDKQREAIKAANAWAQSLEARSLAVLTDEDFNKLPEYTRMTLSQKLKDIKNIYFIYPGKIEAWPKGLLKISVQDLIDYNRVPAFENMVGMLTLSLEDKNLTSLEGLRNIPYIKAVQWLLLSGNQLTTLPAGIFNGLTALQELSLGNNQLRTLQPDLFNGLTALQGLKLRNNQLTTLPANIFKDLTALRVLWLDDNQLTTLPEGIFKDLTALDGLYLRNNQLTSLPADVFNGLKALQMLYLNDNQLSDEQVEIIRTALQGRDIYLKIGNQRPPVEDESALTGSSTGSEMADDSAGGKKRTLDERGDQEADEDRNNNGKRQK